MDCHAVNLALTGGRQLKKVSFGRCVQTILKYLGHGRTFRAVRSAGSRCSGRFLSHRLFDRIRLDRFGRLLALFWLGGSGRSCGRLAVLDGLIVLGRLGRFLALLRLGGSWRICGRLAVLDRLIVLGRLNGFLALLQLGGDGGRKRSRRCFDILGRLWLLCGLCGGRRRSYGRCPKRTDQRVFLFVGHWFTSVFKIYVEKCVSI